MVIVLYCLVIFLICVHYVHGFARQRIDYRGISLPSLKIARFPHDTHHIDRKELVSCKATTDDFPKSAKFNSLERSRMVLRRTLQIIAGNYMCGAAKSSNADERKTSALPKYLERTLNFAAGKRSMTLYQGFAVNKGKSPARDGGDRTGTYTWSGGIELASLLLKRSPVDVAGKRVIDLGTGTGVTGIAAVWAGAKEVAMTDGATEVLEVCSLNVKKNIDNVLLNGDALNFAADNKRKVAVGRLRWGNDAEIRNWLHWRPSSADASETQSELYDVVIATEVAYERKSIDILLSTIGSLVKPVSEGGIVLLRLTPELTDNSRGLDYLLMAIREKKFEIVKFPEIDDDNSQFLQLVCMQS